MSNRFDLTGKIALVTGASSGLGAHFAQVLADAGARVVVAARRKEKLDALVTDIVDRGGEALAVDMDVTSAASVDAAFHIRGVERRLSRSSDDWILEPYSAEIYLKMWHCGLRY